MEAASGIEPLNRGFADPRLTTWLRRPDDSPLLRGAAAEGLRARLTGSLSSLKCMPRWRWRQPGARPDALPSGRRVLQWRPRQRPATVPTERGPPGDEGAMTTPLRDERRAIASSQAAPKPAAVALPRKRPPPRPRRQALERACSGRARRQPLDPPPGVRLGLAGDRREPAANRGGDGGPAHGLPVGRGGHRGRGDRHTDTLRHLHVHRRAGDKHYGVGGAAHRRAATGRGLTGTETVGAAGAGGGSAFGALRRTGGRAHRPAAGRRIHGGQARRQLPADHVPLLGVPHRVLCAGCRATRRR